MFQKVAKFLSLLPNERTTATDSEEEEEDQTSHGLANRCELEQNDQTSIPVPTSGAASSSLEEGRFENEDGDEDPLSDYSSPEVFSEAEILLILDALPSAQHNNHSWYLHAFCEPIEDLREFTVVLEWTMKFSPSSQAFKADSHNISGPADQEREEAYRSEFYRTVKFRPISVQFSDFFCKQELPTVISLKLDQYSTEFLAISNTRKARYARTVIGGAVLSSDGSPVNNSSSHRIGIADFPYKADKEEKIVIVEHSELVAMYCCGLDGASLGELEVDLIRRPHENQLPVSAEPAEDDQSPSTADCAESEVLDSEESETGPRSHSSASNSTPRSSLPIYQVDSTAAAADASTEMEPEIILRNGYVKGLRCDYVVIRRTLRLAILLNSLTSTDATLAESIDYHRKRHWGGLILLPDFLWARIKIQVPRQLQIRYLRDLVPSMIDFPALSKATKCDSTLNFSATVTVVAFPSQ